MIKKLDAFSCILKAIERVHKRDISTEKITLTPPDYHKLLSHSAYRDYSGIGSALSPSDLTSNYKGSIFGIDIEVGEKSKIYGIREGRTSIRPDDPLRIRGKYYPETRRFEPEPFSVPIDFKYVEVSIPQIMIKSRASLFEAQDKNEWVALDTLREMISETDFRKYLKYGFVLVKGRSGDVYQVFRKRSHTKVWRGGKVVKEICVRLDSSRVQAPPTDNVIAFKTIIEADEKSFESLGNVYRNLDKVA